MLVEGTAAGELVASMSAGKVTAADGLGQALRAPKEGQRVEPTPQPDTHPGPSHFLTSRLAQQPVGISLRRSTSRAGLSAREYAVVRSSFRSMLAVLGMGTITERLSLLNGTAAAARQPV
jgi:hypothetical protein